MKKSGYYRLLVLSGVFLTMLTGCTPSESIPPVFGPESERILLYMLLIAISYLLCYFYINRLDTKKEKFENDLRDIFSRLDRIEKDIQNIKFERKGNNHEKR